MVFERKGALCEASRIDCLMAVLDAIMVVKTRIDTPYTRPLKNRGKKISIEIL